MAQGLIKVFFPGYGSNFWSKIRVPSWFRCHFFSISYFLYVFILQTLSYLMLKLEVSVTFYNWTFWYIINNYPMTPQKINRFIVSRISKPMKGEVQPRPFIGLRRSEHDQSVYFWLCRGYLHRSRKLAKTHPVFLLSEEILSPQSCLFWPQPQQSIRIQNLTKSPLWQCILL